MPDSSIIYHIIATTQLLGEEEKQKAEAKFQLIAEAYEVLSDPEKRLVTAVYRYACMLIYVDI